MKLLLRAITTPTEPDPRFVTLTEDGLMAWASEVADDAAGPTREDMLEHHHLVNEIEARVDACLPARFPTQLADRDALAKTIAANSEGLARQMERVRGRCEVAVTVADPTHGQAPATGREYLVTRQKRYALARELAQRVTDALDGELVQSQTRVCPSPSVALSMALLVRRSDAEEVIATLRRVAADVRILVNGPWPPYSFAGLNSDKGDG